MLIIFHPLYSKRTARIEQLVHQLVIQKVKKVLFYLLKFWI